MDPLILRIDENSILYNTAPSLHQYKWNEQLDLPSLQILCVLLSRLLKPKQKDSSVWKIIKQEKEKLIFFSVLIQIICIFQNSSELFQDLPQKGKTLNGHKLSRVQTGINKLFSLSFPEFWSKMRLNFPEKLLKICKFSLSRLHNW